MNIVLLGGPGAGKGTQAVYLAREFGLTHVSTGEYFRKIMAEKTELGLVADSFISKGFLVPDEIVVKIVADRLALDDCQHGFILDGFPRTLMQATALKELYKIDHCINIDVASDKLIKRILGRRVCSKCGKNFHVDIHDIAACQSCGGVLHTRDDDTLETVTARLKVYHQTTSLLIDFYQSEGTLITVDGSKAIEEVFNDIKKQLLLVNNTL